MAQGIFLVKLANAKGGAAAAGRQRGKFYRWTRNHSALHNLHAWSKTGACFVPPLTSNLSLPERTAHYRAKAQDALQRASVTADPSLRDGLLRLAAGWHGLARELETKNVRFTAAEAEAASRPPRERPARR